MATKSKSASKQNNSNKSLSMQEFINTYCNYGTFKGFLLNPAQLLPVACVLFVAEMVINVTVIERVKYTEIDWKAYMQEVEGVLNGTLDYSQLKGDTGPLVYPAGFVWIFTILYAVTNAGTNIRLGQYIYAIFYLINLALVLRIYLKAKKVPPYLIILTCMTSYRIHSIFVLRLFNDPVAVLFFYASLNAFLDSRWSLGSFLFSVAVSVKMNILLYAPALLLAYLTCLGLTQTIIQLAICASVQIVLALPFLLAHPVSYILGAFDLGRVFLYEWTVNWRFLPEEVFVSKIFHLCLLFVHLTLLALFYKPSVVYLKSYSKLKAVENDIKDQLKKNSKFNMTTSSQLFLLPMFLCNLVGMACSRSLHYQFYIWYFHSLPFLTWSTHYSVKVRLILLGVIELCWNTFPSTIWSSAALHGCHFAILYGIYRTVKIVLTHKHE